MKAAIFKTVGEPIEVFDDVEIIDPRVGEVRVRIKNCSLCHSDLSVVDGSFPNFGPVILGHEASGIVESVGTGVSHLAVGDHVILTPTPPCGHCYFCQREEQNLCLNNRSILTSTLPDGQTGLSHRGESIFRGLGVGGFAELVVTPATGAIKIPDDIPLELACVIGCAMQTGVGAVLNTAKVEEGATVLVMGLGGVGLAAVQGARIAGAATILVSDPVAERRQIALRVGATHAIDPFKDNLIKRCMALTNQIGMDYAFETAGQATLIETGLQATRMGGTTICVGAPPLDQGFSINPAVLFSSCEKKICGCLMGSSNSLFEIPRLIRLWQAGRLDLESMVTAHRPLSEINQAFGDLKANKGIRTVLSIY